MKTDTKKETVRQTRSNKFKFRGAVAIVNGKPIIRQRNRDVDIFRRIDDWSDVAKSGLRIAYAIATQNKSMPSLMSFDRSHLKADMKRSGLSRIHVEVSFVA